MKLIIKYKPAIMSATHRSVELNSKKSINNYQLHSLFTIQNSLIELVHHGVN
jgi:hypothetical protein